MDTDQTGYVGNMLYTLRLLSLAVIVGLSTVSPANATFSIVACDDQSGRCGVAVATHNLAVGNSVPFAKAGVGAGVSQFETNPLHKQIILGALTDGETAEGALALALDGDSQFEDGNDVSFRQIGVVSFCGTASAFTGQKASAYAGHKSQEFVSVQGNGLVSDAVLHAMWDHFHASRGSLEERLMSALEAGYAEGGQRTGVTSAALLVSTPEGWPVDIDYRVDFAPDTAISELRATFDAGLARQRLFQARLLMESGDIDRAQAYIPEALQRAQNWDRIWLSAAWMAEEAGDSASALARFCRFRELNSEWAELLSDEIDFSECDASP